MQPRPTQVRGGLHGRTPGLTTESGQPTRVSAVRMRASGELRTESSGLTGESPRLTLVPPGLTHIPALLQQLSRELLRESGRLTAVRLVERRS